MCKKICGFILIENTLANKSLCDVKRIHVTCESGHGKCDITNVVVCGVGHNIRCKAISHENHGGDPV